jgi:3-dehydroquinate dehydratase-1
MKMKVPIKFDASLTHQAVVGTIHSAESLRAGLKLRKGDCDWVELRVDCFFPDAGDLRKAAGKLRVPRIVTVRHASEGGKAKMTERERRGLYEEVLTVAGMVDIELRQAARMAGVIAQAREAGVGLILSHHDFQRTPSAGRLRELAERARDAGADIFKVAAMTRTPGDVARLVEFLADEKNGAPLSVMGMGRYGKVSRLVLAEAGSCLNYGYLGSPNASGQWPVEVLKRRIAELREGGRV